jgi:uncharacterized membrane protein YcaP (DUF421 family)
MLAPLGTWITSQFGKQGIDLGDAQAALRQHGLERVEQMKLATLEEDGSISIVASDGGGDADAPHSRQQRRRRYRRGGL